MQFNALLVFMLTSNLLMPQLNLNVQPNSWRLLILRRQDQLVFHVILSSMDQNVITLLGSEQTSKQAWDSYSHHVTLGWSLSLQQRLSIYYLQSIMALSNELGLIKYPLDDIVIHTHNGLDS